MLSKQLIKELRAVKEAILKEPKKFDMRWFINARNHGDLEHEYNQLLTVTDCGTTACIYGWHSALFDFNGASSDDLYNQLGCDVKFNILCYNEQWPEPFKSRYQKAKTHITRAKVAAERIEHFITTGGEE